MTLGDFNWRVFEAGSEWKTPAPPWSGGQILIAKRPWPSREYLPFSLHTGLFRAFADLVPEPEAILAFADRFGHLSQVVSPSSESPDDEKNVAAEPLKDRISNPLDSCETLAFWQSHIGAMKTAVDLWDRIQLGKVDPDETRRVAQAIGEGCHGRFEMRASYDSTTKRFGWSMTPCDLIGAMWMQFSKTVENNTVHRRCPVCAEWFELSPRAVRADKQHCSPECRHKAYRDRKQLALELQTTGLSVVQIAKQLGSDVKTVQGWLKTTKHGGQEDDGLLTENERHLDLEPDGSEAQ